MSQNLNSKIAVIGIDIGKNSFHLVSQDRRGALVLRQVPRSLRICRLPRARNHISDIQSTRQRRRKNTVAHPWPHYLGMAYHQNARAGSPKFFPVGQRGGPVDPRKASSGLGEEDNHRPWPRLPTRASHRANSVNDFSGLVEKIAPTKPGLGRP